MADEETTESTETVPTLPEGLTDEEVVTPVKLAKELSEGAETETRPQIVYGWIRNGNLPSYLRSGTTGPRLIIRSEFETWRQEKDQRKAERAAKKAEKEAKAAEKAAAKGEVSEEGAAEGEPAEEYAG